MLKFLNDMFPAIIRICYFLEQQLTITMIIDSSVHSVFEIVKKGHHESFDWSWSIL